MENFLERIVTDPDICFGKPRIKGTRMAAAFVLQHLAAGDSEEDILEAFPFLAKEDIRACLLYAAGLLERKPLTREVNLSVE